MVVPRRGTAAYSALHFSEGARLVSLLQLQVERGAVVVHAAFEGLYGLVALHNLHLGHGLRRHVLRGLVVLSAHKVKPLDVHLVYGFALIAYLSVVAHLYAGHPLQHFFYAPVLLLTESVHVIEQRILAPRYRVGGHCDVFKLHGGAFQPCVIPRPALLQGCAQRLVAEECELYPPPFGHGFYPVRTVTLCQRVSQERVLAVEQLARDVAHGLPLAVCHSPGERRFTALRHGVCARKQDGKQ